MRESGGPARGSISRTVLVAQAVVLLLIVGGTLGGLGGLLACLGLAASALGLAAVARARRRGSRPENRGTAAMVLATGLTLFVAGGAAVAQPTAPASIPPVGADAGPAVRAPSAAPRTALAVLATLAVKGPSPMTGYDRTARFGDAWLDVDRNGCDTRDDVLRRDLERVAGTGCRVLAGVLHDPYTRTTIRFTRGERTSTAVQIDHAVALADAWRTGAQRLPEARRIDLANDPVNLFAVDGPTNEAKGDGDTATWLPPNTAFRCTYVAHQVGVKAAYGLWVTRAEKAAMQRVLAHCPTDRAPVSTLAHAVPPGTAHPAPSHRPSATPSPTARPTAGAVHPGAYCSPAGATGVTRAGTPMVCSVGSAGGRARWRSAA